MSSISPEVDVAIVGAGFAGMYQLQRARAAGLTARVIERGSDVGGTWYWNRYPGARCDIPSLEYSYQFDDELQQEWEWQERYAPQPEILSYANHVADRFDLRDDISFNTSVTGARFADGHWLITTDSDLAVSAQFLVMATGCLSSTNVPDFPGLDTFTGPVYHTGKWPHDPVDFQGHRVGVIGTGSSGIQSIPIIAEQAASLTVFQRTANYAIPAHNEALDPERQADVKSRYSDFRAANRTMSSAFGAEFPQNDAAAMSVSESERFQQYEDAWRAGGLPFLRSFNDLALDAEANETAAEFVRSKIRQVVKDPATAELLSPKQTIGCKRLCVDSGYFETFNRDTVSLVDVSSEPISHFTSNGVVVGDTEFEFDAVVLATGFDAMTGSLLAMDIRGTDGVTLQEAWAEGPKNYLGLTIAGFPNLFTVTGPGSPSVLTNMMVSIEQHVDFITDTIEALRSQGLATIEATTEAQEEWVSHVNGIADLTLFTTCNSWYLGANVPGKKRVFMPLLGFPGYVKKCDEVVANGYEGFVLT